MSEFVEECRREWKRLRVPAAIADEMADDLAADLEEAEADGASAEEVLGSGASDPRAFAAAWASERGIARVPWSDRILRRWLLVPAGLLVAACGIVAFLSFDDNAAPNALTGVAPGPVVPGRIVGTSIIGGKAIPAGVALVIGRRNVLRERPRSITVTIQNSGTRTIELAHVIVQIGRHTFRFTRAHMLPNGQRSVRFALPADVPNRFFVVTRTLPVPGETNTSNNQQAWRVVIAK